MSLPQKVPLDTKIGFDIGWDYYAHTLLPPGNLSEEERLLVQAGLRAAKERNIKRLSYDRFVIKWLHLRLNAWRRNRAFDPQVTPDFIRSIDVTHCPITGIKLTHGSGSDSDWSVDRVNNNAAYSPGNLVVVSALANIAKGSRSFEQIARFCSPDPALPAPQLPHGIDDMRALTKLEWMRWQAITSHVIVFTDDPGALGFAVAPCVCLPPQNIPMSPSSAMQLAISMFALQTDSKPLNSMIAKLAKPKRVMLNRLITRAKKARCPGMRICDLWFNERLFNEFFDLFSSLDEQDLHAISWMGYRTMSSRSQGKPEMVCDLDNWQVDSAGYVPEDPRQTAANLAKQQAEVILDEALPA